MSFLAICFGILILSISIGLLALIAAFIAALAKMFRDDASTSHPALMRRKP